GHAFHEVLIETKPKPRNVVAGGVGEFYDAAALLAFTTALEFENLSKTFRCLDQVTGQYFLAALQKEHLTPEQFKGGPDEDSQKVLDAVAVDMMARQYPAEVVKVALRMIASDMFLILPGDTEPSPY